MTLLKCPECGKGKPELKVIPELETMFEGVMVKIPNAKISQCPACGKKTYAARELKRWRNVMRDVMKFVERKVFEDFGRCKDQRAYDAAYNAACEGQRDGEYRVFYVGRIYQDAELEYLRQWLFKQGITEDDEIVFLSIRW